MEEVEAGCGVSVASCFCDSEEIVHVLTRAWY